LPAEYLPPCHRLIAPEEESGGLWILRIGPQLLIFYRNLLNLKLLFKNQKKLNLSPVFKWLDISKLKMPKLIDLCDKVIGKKTHQCFLQAS
jgi:hypothetical protein